MTIVANTTSGTTVQTSSQNKTGLGSLGQGDFLNLMTAQLRMQDPFDPVDNKEMLAQMAEFSSLSGIAEMNDTLKEKKKKLDATISVGSSV